MRMYKFFSLALVALALGACSSTDDVDNNPNGGKPGEDRYLAVNLQNVGSTPNSRAANGSYEDGTEEESKISKVRFYFFNADGSPYLLNNSTNTSGEHVNWLEPANDYNTGTGDADHTIEQISKTVLLINGQTSAAPSSVIAVVNPQTMTALGDGQHELEEVKTKITDTKFVANDNGSLSNFVMSNSVYVNANEAVCAAQVSGHVTTTAEAAQKDPLDIYVERVVAKVTANVDTEYKKDGEADAAWQKGNGTNWDKDKFGIQVGVINSVEPVYAVVEGWSVADEDGEAELEKQVSTAWNSVDLGINPWTTADYHRSFWSQSVPFLTGGNQPVNHNYTAISSSFGQAVYTLPNTPTKVSDFANINDNTLTKFILATKLVYKDKSTQEWRPAEICEYKGIEYLGEGSVAKIIAKENSNIYVKKGETYETLSDNDITFTTTKLEGSQSYNEFKDYNVIATLKDAARQDLYVDKGTGDNHDWQSISAADVNLKLAATAAEIRKDGMAYYYTPIRHLGTDPQKVGYYGIVRNHVYKINLQNIKGFGTPVYDPSKVIDPTVPSNEQTYLAARINVLQWRVVASDVNLDQTGK